MVFSNMFIGLYMVSTKLNKKLLILFITCCLCFTLFVSCFSWTRITGQSMQPTLQENSRILELKAGWKNEIQRFSIITFREENRSLVKRVIGMPGEVIEFRNNKIYIDKRLLYDPWWSSDQEYENKLVIIASDEYFVMGDNRNISYDSRALGPIKMSQIEGVSLFIWK